MKIGNRVKIHIIMDKRVFNKQIPDRVGIIAGIYTYFVLIQFANYRECFSFNDYNIKFIWILYRPSQALWRMVTLSDTRHMRIILLPNI